jgi:hypothetical protein
MANPRRFELEDIVNRPGTYFNPQIEVLIVVDDSPDIDTGIFDMEDMEGDEWVLVSDETPLDEAVRDEMLERFQARHHPGTSGAVAATEDDTEEVDELQPDEEEER